MLSWWVHSPLESVSDSPNPPWPFGAQAWELAVVADVVATVLNDVPSVQPPTSSEPERSSPTPLLMTGDFCTIEESLVHLCLSALPRLLTPSNQPSLSGLTFIMLTVLGAFGVVLATGGYDSIHHGLCATLDAGLHATRSGCNG